MRKHLTASTLGALALVAALRITPASAAAYDPTVYRAQVALNQNGYDAGTPDGRIGPHTRAAIEAFQRANGMRPTGLLSRSLASQIEGNTAPQARRPDRDDRLDMRVEDHGRMSQSELTRATQIELTRHGYYPTYVGGRLNGDTADAIRDFQRQHGMEATGAPSERLLAELRHDTRRVEPNHMWRDRRSDNANPPLTQRELITQTEFELRRHGYSIASVGGGVDADTTVAIRSYQRSNALPQTGLPSDNLLIQLRADNRVVGQTQPPARTTYPVSGSTYQVTPAAPAQCADFFHQDRPGGSDYNGPPVPGCTN